MEAPLYAFGDWSNGAVEWSTVKQKARAVPG
jgi:hypothetical protein